MYRGDTGQFVVIAGCPPVDCRSRNTTLLLDLDLRTGHSTRIGMLAAEPGESEFAFDRSGDIFAYHAHTSTCRGMSGRARTPFFAPR